MAPGLIVVLGIAAVVLLGFLFDYRSKRRTRGERGNVDARTQSKGATEAKRHARMLGAHPMPDSGKRRSER